MNGARSIFMRKGYWLTALAAIVLLAASPGTASAQVTVTAPDVVEGERATITVTGKASIPADTDATEVTLTVVAASDDSNGEENDVSQNLGNVATLRFPANTNEAGGEAITSTQTAILIVQTNHDPDAEDETITLGQTLGNVGQLLNAAAGGGALDEDADNPTSFDIEDDETQTYVLDVETDDPEEGMDINVTLKAEPAHVDDALMLTLHSDNAKYILDETTANIGQGGVASRALVVTTPDNDGNRVEDSFTLAAYSGSAGRSTEQASVTIKVADIHALPAVAMMVVDEDGDPLEMQPTSVPEGESVMVAVMPVNKDGDAIDAEEELKVALTPTGTADAADYTLVGTFTIPFTDDISNAVEIEVRSDEDVGMESLMFDAVVSGDSANGPGTLTSAGVLSLYIDDATAKQIEPKSSDADYDAIKAATADLNPGETVELMTSDLFTVTEGFSAGYSVSVEGDSVSAFASGEVVTINAEMAGESKVTVTGTASMSTSSLMPSQTVSNVASLTFPVMVVDTTLVVTLSADPMEIAEGGTSTITATASRAVTVGDGDVEIALAVVPSDGGTLDPESIMIAMGDMSGSAVLTSTEDDDMDNETVTVVATGSGVTGLMQVAVAVTDNDEAPAIPNQISAKPQDEAYPVITAAIAAGAGDDEMLTPGESVELMASDLFMVMDGYTASYRVSVDGTAVSGSVSGDSISVMAGAAGEAKVTITGVAKMAASSFEASQDATNVASITFPVTVEAEPVPEPVPALPLIAQWLLGLGLLGGGARQLFRRRRQGS